MWTKRSVLSLTAACILLVALGEARSDEPERPGELRKEMAELKSAVQKINQRIEELNGRLKRLESPKVKVIRAEDGVDLPSWLESRSKHRNLRFPAAVERAMMGERVRWRQLEPPNINRTPRR